MEFFEFFIGLVLLFSIVWIVGFPWISPSFQDFSVNWSKAWQKDSNSTVDALYSVINSIQNPIFVMVIAIFLMSIVTRKRMQVVRMIIYYSAISYLVSISKMRLWRSLVCAFSRRSRKSIRTWNTAGRLSRLA